MPVEAARPCRASVHGADEGRKARVREHEIHRPLIEARVGEELDDDVAAGIGRVAWALVRDESIDDGAFGRAGRIRSRAGIHDDVGQR